MLNQNTRKTYRRMYRIYTEEKRLPVKPGKIERDLHDRNKKMILESIKEIKF